MMPIVILAGNGRIPKNIKTALVNASKIPIVNGIRFKFFIFFLPFTKKTTSKIINNDNIEIKIGGGRGSIR